MARHQYEPAHPRSPRALIAAAIVTALAAAGGCASILGIEETARKPASGEDFQCVGMDPKPGEDGSKADAGRDVRIVAQITDIATGEPLKGIQVATCVTRFDTECAGGTEKSDGDGFVRMPVTPPFDGYLRIEGQEEGAEDAEEDDQRVTYLWYFSRPIVATRDKPFPIYLMTRGFRKSVLYDPERVPHDPKRGELAINVVDCRDENAPNITFVLTTGPQDTDEDTHPFYYADGLIALPSEERNMHTDGDGLGGFVRVAGGEVGFSAIDAQGREVSTDTLLVEPDALTTVRLLPE